MLSKPAFAALIPIALLAAAACTDGSPVEPRVPARPLLAASSPAEHFSVPIDLTLAGGTCGLTTDVHITGSLDVIFHLVEGPSGVVRYIVTESARGTGAGDDGSRYRFSYNYEETGDFTSFPAHIKVHDVFLLVGQQGAPNINAAFLLDVIIPEVGDPSVDVKLERGNPFLCDPI